MELYLPILDEKPALVAETRPARVLDFVQNLPMAKPLEASVKLLDELQILNRQKVSAEVRMRTLELYRQPLATLADSLVHGYASASLPLSGDAEKFSNMAEGLWQELAIGYKLVYVDLKSKLFGFNDAKPKAFAVQRAIDALGRQMLVCYLGYRRSPNRLWNDIHRLYFYAVKEKLIDLSVLVAKDQAEITTINLAYKQILLFDLADPQSLTTDNIFRLVDYLKVHAKQVVLEGIKPQENMRGVFLVQLDSDESPLPYHRVTQAPDPITDIHLLTTGLLHLAEQHLVALQRGIIPKNSGIGNDALDYQFQDLLHYLIEQWGMPPKRAYHRLPRTELVTLGIGIPAMHRVLTEEKHSAKATEVDYSKSKWQMLDISAGGMALRGMAIRKDPLSVDTIRVGDMLSVKSGRGNWAIGICRWASNDTHLEVGIELIAPTAEPIRIKSPKHADFELGLMLPEIAAIRQNQMLATPNGIYGPAQALEVETEKKSFQVMATTLLERTRGFERFHYSIL